MYSLIEINSRYSYVCNYLHFGTVSEATIDLRGKEQCEEVRNLLNRTRLALGAPPGTLPPNEGPF